APGLLDDNGAQHAQGLVWDAEVLVRPGRVEGLLEGGVRVEQAGVERLGPRRELRVRLVRGLGWITGRAVLSRGRVLPGHRATLGDRHRVGINLVRVGHLHRRAAGRGPSARRCRATGGSATRGSTTAATGDERARTGEGEAGQESAAAEPSL